MLYLFQKLYDMADKEGALKEKEQGNAAYKAKNFTKAIAHYEKVSLNPIFLQGSNKLNYRQ